MKPAFSLIWILKRSMVFTLALSISGVLPVIRQASADGASVNILEINNQTAALDESIKLQIRRARRTDSPGTPPGMPTSFEITQIENQFKEWKTKIEAVMALPNVPSRPGETFIPLDKKNLGLNTYLSELTLLTTLRIAMKMNHSAEWSDPFCLRVPTSILAMSPSLKKLTSNRMGDRFNPTQVDTSQDPSGATVCLKTSASVVQGLELGALADVQNSETNLTMIKYLATRQLMSNLADLRYIKQDHHVEIPQIEATLRNELKKIPAMNWAAVLGEQERAIAEPGARASLVQSYATVSEQFPNFLNEEFLNSITQAAIKAEATNPESLCAKGLAKNPRVLDVSKCAKRTDDQIASLLAAATKTDTAPVKTPLREILIAAENEGTSDFIEKELNSAVVSFSTQTAAENLAALPGVLAGAKANTVLEKIYAMVFEGTLPPMNAEQSRYVLGLIDSRKESYQKSLSASAISHWREAAGRVNEEFIYTSQRNGFIENLLLRAPEVVRSVQRNSSGETVDPMILAAVFSAETLKLGASEAANNWFYAIRSAGSYIAARSAYNSIISQATTPNVVVNGIVDPAQAENFAATHDFTPHLPFTDHTLPELQSRIHSRIANTQRADLRALIQYGNWFGFHRVFPGANPSVAEVLTSADHLTDYYKRAELAASTQYPILGTEVEVKDSQGQLRKVHLADALVAINPHRTSSTTVLQEAEQLVDQGLAQIETRIRKNIETIAHAQSGAEIEKVVTSSMMLSLVMHGFPEFHAFEEQFLEQLLSPSITDQVMRRYVNQSMLYGFTSVFLLKGVTWGSKYVFKRVFPFANVLTEGLEAVLAGFMRGALVMIVADEAYEVSNVAHQGSQVQQQEDFFLCSAEGGCFTTAGDLEGATSAYTRAKWMLGGRLLADFGMLYVPMGYKLSSRMGDPVTIAEMMADNKAFEAMKAKPGEFGTVEKQMKIARAIREGRPAEAEVAQPKRGYGGWLKLLGTPTRAGVEGWISVSDLVKITELSTSVPKMTAQEWSAFEEAYVRLAGKIRAGTTYRLSTVFDRLAIEDAFKTLDLSAKNPESWGKIDAAADLHESGALSVDKENKIRLVQRFLKIYSEENPSIKTQTFKPVSDAERKLLAALHRSPMVDQIWKEILNEYSRRDTQDSGPSFVIAPGSITPAQKPIPAVNAPGSTGGPLN